MDRVGYCLIVLLLCAVSCKDNVLKGDFEDTKIIDTFPAAATIESNGKLLELDAIGILDFRVIDSLLLVSTDSKSKMWHVYRLPDVGLVKQFLDLGQGPCEVSSAVPFMYTSFTIDSFGNRHINFFERPTKRLVDIDLSRISASADLRDFMTEEYNQPVSTMELYSFLMPDGDIYNITLDIDDGMVIRNIKRQSQDVTPAAILMLNDMYKVRDLSQFGTILSMPLFSPDGRYIADVNANGCINIFDLQEDKAVSVLHSVDGDGEIRLSGNQTFPEYFTVSRTDISTGRSSIEFIGWDGTPRFDLELPTDNVIFSQVDLAGGKLYIFDPETEGIMQYEIKLPVLSIP